MKILLVRNDNLGDLICTTPAIEALRKKFSSAQIDILVNSYNFPAIRENPFVDKIFVYTKTKHVKGFLKKGRAFFGKIKVMGEIFKEGYDVCVVFRGGYSPYAEQFAKISRAKFKIGPRNLKGKDIFDYKVEFIEKHEVLLCFDFLKPFKIVYSGEKPLFVVKEEEKRPFKFLTEEKAILFHISSRLKDNKMSFRKLLRIIEGIKKKFKNPLYLSFAPGDEDLVKRLSEKLGVKYLKFRNIYEFAGGISSSEVFISLDGGSVHLGPAVGIPTIALFGSTSLERWHPWGYRDLVVKSKTGKAEDINPEEVFEKLKLVLS